jgi:hypothetical protein
MVWVKHVSMKPVFVCGLCGLGYPDAKTALACEAFCGKNHARSSIIAKKAIYRPES